MCCDDQFSITEHIKRFKCYGNCENANNGTNRNGTNNGNSTNADKKWDVCIDKSPKT